MPARTAAGYLTITSVSNVPTAIAEHGHAIAAPALRELTCERLDSRARGTGVRHPGHPMMRRERDVDDPPSRSRCECQLMRGLSHVQHPLDIQPRDGAPPLRGDQLGGAEELPAGVVDEQVEPRVALEHSADHPPRVGTLANVADDRAHPLGLRPDHPANLSSSLSEHILPPPGNRHARAAARELERGRLAEPGPAAGDERARPIKHLAREDRRHGTADIWPNACLCPNA